MAHKTKLEDFLSKQTDEDRVFEAVACVLGLWCEKHTEEIENTDEAVFTVYRSGMIPWSYEQVYEYLDEWALE